MINDRDSLPDFMLWEFNTPFSLFLKVSFLRTGKSPAMHPFFKEGYDLLRKFEL
jgi:hypothetical protein